MDLSTPPTVPQTAPGKAYQSQIMEFVFDHVPDLRELLTKFRGRPGFDYLQCTVSNLRRAQDEGWSEVENAQVYIIRGPKGEATMKLLGRGQPIPGAAHNSGARLCTCDRTVEDLTGLWINPHKHTEEPEVVAKDLAQPKSKMPTLGRVDESMIPSKDAIDASLKK